MLRNFTQPECPLSRIGLKGNEARFKEVFFWVLIGEINNLFLVQPDLNSVINNQNAEFIPLEGNLILSCSSPFASQSFRYNPTGSPAAPRPMFT